MTESMAPIVPVHIVSDATKQTATPATKEIVFGCNTYPFAVTGGSPAQILSHTPKRKRASIIVGGATGIVVIGTSQSDCQSALANAATEITGNVTVVNTAYLHAPIVVEGTGELWAALVSTSDALTFVSVIKEVEQ